MSAGKDERVLCLCFDAELDVCQATLARAREGKARCDGSLDRLDDHRLALGRNLSAATVCQLHPRTHARARARTHTDTRTQTRTHTLTDTHANTACLSAATSPPPRSTNNHHPPAHARARKPARTHTHTHAPPGAGPATRHHPPSSSSCNQPHTSCPQIHTNCNETQTRASARKFAREGGRGVKKMGAAV